MSTTNCTVCSSSTTKYKCHACLERTCSLNCFKSHASLHQTNLSAKTAENGAPPISQTTTNPTSDDHQPAPANPLVEFATSRELQELLRLNPDLRERLRAIYNGARDADGATASAAAHGTRGSRRTPWQRPDHLEKGVTDIKTALEDGGTGSEAMRNFVDIVTKRSSSLPGAVELETASKP